MGLSGERIGYLIAAFFALGIPAALIQMVPGSGFLRIDASGVTFSNVFRRTFLRWSDIETFYVVTLRSHGIKAHEMVGFEYAPACDRSRTARKLAKFISDCEGALPDTYGKKASDLAELLNARLAEAKAHRTA